MSGSDPLHLVAALRGALETARSVRTRQDLSGALDRIAGVIADALGYGMVAINLHRPEWDDFEVATIHGPADVRQALLGTSRTWEAWAPFLSPRFERRGVHHVVAGAIPREVVHSPYFTWSCRATAERVEDCAAWHRDDLLLVVLRRANGDVLGVVSVDEPTGGHRPSDDDLDRLVAVAHIAALAVEQAQEARSTAGHRAALERLLTVSSRIADQRSREGVLDEVCAGIRDALGFERVVVLLGDDHGMLRPAATAGWEIDDPVLDLDLTLEALGAVMQPAHERDGCYLLRHHEAEELLDLQGSFYRSRINGRGPHAWDRHWLVVPLRGADTGPRGVIWVEDPTDRLLPGKERLQALRLFADQAAAALEAARDFEATSHRAAHDPLTGLANRATFADRLRHAVQRTKRTPGAIAVLFIDLDRFKDINDSLGHAAGDELLRTVAARIDEDLRPGDTVARFGGDEFVVLCEDVSGPPAAFEIAERVRMTVAHPIQLSAGVAHVTASVGIALPDRADRTAESILQAADRAMYEAKAAGRDSARLATPGAGWP